MESMGLAKSQSTYSQTNRKNQPLDRRSVRHEIYNQTFSDTMETEQPMYRRQQREARKQVGFITWVVRGFMVLLVLVFIGAYLFFSAQSSEASSVDSGMGYIHYDDISKIEVNDRTGGKDVTYSVRREQVSSLFELPK